MEQQQDQQTIESRVAAAILEKPMAEIEIEGEVYKIAPPSIGTLILISELISKFPIVKDVKREDMLSSVLHYAKDFRKLGEIAAILILGANGLTEKRKAQRKVVEKRFFGLYKQEKVVEDEILIDKKKELSDAILRTMGAKQLYDTIVQRMSDLEISYFFAITTSLSEANILKPTKEVD